MCSSSAGTSFLPVSLSSSIAPSWITPFANNLDQFWSLEQLWVLNYTTCSPHEQVSYRHVTLLTTQSSCMVTLGVTLLCTLLTTQSSCMVTLGVTFLCTLLTTQSSCMVTLGVALLCKCGTCPVDMLTFITSFCHVCRSVESVVQVPTYVREDSSGRYVKDCKEMGSVGGVWEECGRSMGGVWEECGDVWG